MTKNKKEGQVHVNSLSKAQLPVAQLNKSKRWQKLQSKDYRDAYAESQLSIEIPFQIRALRKALGWTQAQLADRCRIPQARISHIEQPGRDPLSLRTLYRLSSAFDVGLLVQFVSFSELVNHEAAFNPEAFHVASFEDDQLEEEEEEEATVSSFEHVKLRMTSEYLSFKYDEVSAGANRVNYRVSISETVVELSAWYLGTAQTTLKRKTKTEMPNSPQGMEIPELNTTTLELQDSLLSDIFFKSTDNHLLSLKRA